MMAPVLQCLLIFSLGVATAEKQQVKVGDVICTVGYIMDTFCIERGTLLDNNSVKTLGAEGPIQHSVHCLVDVPSCVNSPYEVLHDAGAAGDNSIKFGRSWRVESNDLIVSYAKSVGSCSTGCTGELKKGLQAALTGEIINLGDASTPALIRVKKVGSHTDGCNQMNINGTNIMVDVQIPNMIMGGTTSSSYIAFIAHGVLMIVAWGIIMPTGVIVASVLKHRPNNFWFRAHKKIQITGLILAIIGLVIIMMHSTALSDKGAGGSSRYIHGIIGLTIMTIGIFQPINAYFRPHANSGDPKTIKKRQLWELLHKVLGYGVLIVVEVNIWIGIYLQVNRITFSVIWVACGVLILYYYYVALNERKQYEAAATDEQNVDVTDHEHEPNDDQSDEIEVRDI